MEVQNQEMKKEIESDKDEVNDCGTAVENKCEKCKFIGKKQSWTENPCHSKA